MQRNLNKVKFMNHITQNILEHMALSPEKEKWKIQLSHLEACAVCRTQYDNILEFYEMLYNEVDKPSLPSIDKIVDTVSRSYICLSPYDAEVDLSEYEKENTLLLAAESAKVIDGDIILTTLSSQKHRIMVKIEVNPKENMTQAFVITRETNLYSYVLLSLTNGNDSEIFPTNIDGIAAFNYSDKRNWKNDSIVLLLPIISFKIEKANAVDGIISDPSGRISYNLGTNKLFANEELLRSGGKILFIYSNKEYLLQDLNTNNFQAPNYQEGVLIEVKIF